MGDYEIDVKELAAETLALSVAMAHILDNLRSINPQIAAAIDAGFNDAASDLENITFQLAKSANSDQSVKALRIVENLRAVTLGEHRKPNSGV